MAEAQAVFGVEHITHSDLPQIMAALLVVTALREPVALVRAGHPGIEVGRVVGQQPPADELLLFPDADQPPLRFIQFVVGIAVGLDLVKAIPESLRTEAIRRKLPLSLQN